MAEGVALAEFKQGIQLLRTGKPKSALDHFRKASELEKQNPYYMSFTGVALARAEKSGRMQAVKLCETASSLKYNEVQLQLNLAEVYEAAGRRGDALTTLNRAAVAFGRHRGVQKARLKLGARRAPVLSFLTRENILNRHLGRWRHSALDWAEKARHPVVYSFLDLLLCDMSSKDLSRA
jgi:tetratricopeptide (TPR) repeat protein